MTHEATALQPQGGTAERIAHSLRHNLTRTAFVPFLAVAAVKAVSASLKSKPESAIEVDSIAKPTLFDKSTAIFEKAIEATMNTADNALVGTWHDHTNGTNYEYVAMDAPVPKGYLYLMRPVLDAEVTPHEFRFSASTPGYDPATLEPQGQLTREFVIDKFGSLFSMEHGAEGEPQARKIEGAELDGFAEVFENPAIRHFAGTSMPISS
jgi:hypothetical protein